jgi:hypothetical protein
MPTKKMEKNGNNLWANSMKKGMTNVGVAFKILETEPGWSQDSGHIIFFMKMDYTQRAR